MTPPREPTSEECTNNVAIGDGWIAIWYPQMGGYVGKAVIMDDANGGCFEAYVWHDGEFPFGDERPPAHLHHCSAEQFKQFGEDVMRLLVKP